MIDAFHARLEKRMTPEELAVLHQLQGHIYDPENVDTNPYNNIPQAHTVKFLQGISYHIRRTGNNMQYATQPKHTPSVLCVVGYMLQDMCDLHVT